MDRELREVAGRPPASMVGKNIHLRPRGKKPSPPSAPVVIPTTKKEAETFIYGLADPRDHVVRYVGETSRTLAQRLSEHEFKPSNKNVSEWLKSLRAQGVSPEAIVLETCPRSRWQEREIYWIAKLRNEHSLMNVAKGGKFYGRPKGNLTKRLSMAFHRKAIARSGSVKVYTPEEIAEFARQRSQALG